MQLGTPTSQGKRTDLASVKTILDNGGTIDDVQAQFFGTWVRNRKSIEAYAQTAFMRDYRGRPQPKIVVLWSTESGTGKSYWARRNYPDAYWHNVAGSGTQWWDGYQRQDTVVFDEFDSAFMPYRALLQILDRTPLRKPVKGSFVRITAYKFVFTCNCDPTKWYPHQPELDRRLVESAHIIQLGPLNPDGTIAVLNRTAPRGDPIEPNVAALGDPLRELVLARDPAVEPGATQSEPESDSDHGTDNTRRNGRIVINL